MAAVGAGATVVLNSEVQLSPAVLLGAAVIVAMVGTLGAALGIHTTRRRRAKGDDRRYTEPPIRRVRRDGLPSPSVLLVAGLLALGLSQQACAHNGVLEPPLSYGQGAHGAVVLSLSCEVARELLAPDSWIPVDDAAREMADRICSGVTTIGGALLAALSRPPAPSGPVATRTGAMEAEPRAMRMRRSSMSGWSCPVACGRGCRRRRAACAGRWSWLPRRVRTFCSCRSESNSVSAETELPGPVAVAAGRQVEGGSGLRGPFVRPKDE
ncbi:MAG: hypothetical protein M5U09_13615 [Gammaproteobacteria bacterium]|nr:hypothetical protein [Gammaproteobacteria bacterium]